MAEDDRKNYLDPDVLDAIQPYEGAKLASETTAMMGVVGAGAALQQVKTSYTTAVAVQKPRSLPKVVAAVLEEATFAGSSFYYGWVVKNKKTGRESKIEGGSIDLAMAMARNYGNAAIEVEVTETPTHYLFKGIFVDLETGFTCPRLFRQRKGQNIGMDADADRAEDIVFQIGQSKAIRNAVLRAMPEWLEKQAIEAAKRAELKKIRPENLVLSRAQILNFFAPWGVTQDRIENTLGKKIETWGPEDIVQLRGMATALKESRVSPTELFPPVEEEPASQEREQKQQETARLPQPRDEMPPEMSAPAATRRRKSSRQKLEEEQGKPATTIEPQPLPEEDEWVPPEEEDLAGEESYIVPEPEDLITKTPAPQRGSQRSSSATRPVGGSLFDDRPKPVMPASAPPSPRRNEFAEVQARIDALTKVDEELYRKICREMNMWPMSIAAIEKVEAEFKKKLLEKKKSSPAEF